MTIVSKLDETSDNAELLTDVQVTILDDLGVATCCSPDDIFSYHLFFTFTEPLTAFLEINYSKKRPVRSGEGRVCVALVPTVLPKIWEDTRNKRAQSNGEEASVLFLQSILQLTRIDSEVLHQWPERSDASNLQSVISDEDNPSGFTLGKEHHTLLR